jgi:hypothetical protein
MNSLTILVSQNPEVDFPSWICYHAAPQITEVPNTIVVCDECDLLLDRGARIFEKESGREFGVDPQGHIVLCPLTANRRPV